MEIWKQTFSAISVNVLYHIYGRILKPFQNFRLRSNKLVPSTQTREIFQLVWNSFWPAFQKIAVQECEHHYVTVRQL